MMELSTPLKSRFSIQGRDFDLMVDTGSSLLWVAETGDTASCDMPNKLDANTVQPYIPQGDQFPPRINGQYASGTVHGSVYTGKIVDKDHQFGLVDICDFRNPEKVDGILGLSRQQWPAVSVKGETLNFDGFLKMFQAQFAHNVLVYTPLTANVFIGDWNPDIHKDDYTWARLVSDTTWSINGGWTSRDADRDPEPLLGPMLVDTGTSTNLATRARAKAFHESVNRDDPTAKPFTPCSPPGWEGYELYCAPCDSAVFDVAFRSVGSDARVSFIAHSLKLSADGLPVGQCVSALQGMPPQLEEAVKPNEFVLGRQFLDSGSIAFDVQGNRIGFFFEAEDGVIMGLTPNGLTSSFVEQTVLDAWKLTGRVMQ
ncbi:aspartic peptidase domain-containing protein [Mycena maculata]|uniref:Aspartic peptidase domain-containing protein n=1 Tax=Mycena maculata TaxID=230809 RepID=A0AAD7I9I1_9AGAR|nr:aspartic peptidase domain-containing protein [Mycena maculata]